MFLSQSLKWEQCSAAWWRWTQPWDQLLIVFMETWCTYYYLNNSTSICRHAPLYIQEGVWYLFHQTGFLPQSHWTETLLYKRKEILFTVCPFYFLQRKESSLWGKKDDLMVAGRSGGKEIEELNVFFRPFPSPPSVIFFFFLFSLPLFKEEKLSSL